MLYFERLSVEVPPLTTKDAARSEASTRTPCSMPVSCRHLGPLSQRRRKALRYGIDVPVDHVGNVEGYSIDSIIMWLDVHDLRSRERSGPDLYRTRCLLSHPEAWLRP